MEERARRAGMLRKEGGAIRTWKSRWCILRDEKLEYYDGTGEKLGEKKGEIVLRDCSQIQVVDYKKKKYCIELKTPYRNYHICAQSEQDMKEWLDALRAEWEQVGDSQKPAAVVPTESKPVQKLEDIPTDDWGKSVSLDDFEKLKVIGKGSFGKVLLVRYIPDGKPYAMKVLNKKTIIERNEVAHTLSEKRILTRLKCPFFVKLHYAFQTPERLYFVMDYVNGGELFRHLQIERCFSPARVLFYAAEIVLGLEYLHKSGVIYRDLKPENLLLTAEGHICMTDFGISKDNLGKDASTTTFCGTPEYLAPEVLEGKPYGKEVDWWSFGTLVYEMLNGLPPFYSEEVQLMYTKILSAKLTFKKDMDQNAISLLTGLLERDPAKRLADPAVIKAHPYFATINWEKLASLEVSPPYTPNVKSAEDVGMIDGEFLETPLDFSQTDSTNLDNDNFKGFTYGPSTNLQN